MAGLAITPLPLQTIRPGLRVLGKKDKMPKLPKVEYVLHMRDPETRPAVSALGDLIWQMAAEATSAGGAKDGLSSLRRSRPTAGH